MDPIVFVIGGVLILLSILGTLFYVKASNKAELNVLQEQLKLKEMQLQDQMGQYTHLQIEKDQLLSKVSKTEAQLEYSQQALAQAKESNDKISTQLKLEFAEIAQKVMLNNSEQMRAKSEEKIGELLKPLKTELRWHPNHLWGGVGILSAHLKGGCVVPLICRRLPKFRGGNLAATFRLCLQQLLSKFLGFVVRE